MKETIKKENLAEKILNIQSELIAPKNQRNTFGNYDYRSCEDILEALKPLLAKEKLLLTITDKIVNIGDRYYVKATAQIGDSHGEKSISYSAYAREEESKKGMDGSQITGASSSYARKYALNGLFLIDDNKDSDTTNQGEKVSADKKESVADKTQIKDPTSPASDAQKEFIRKLYKQKHEEELPKIGAGKKLGEDKLVVMNKQQASLLIEKFKSKEVKETEQHDIPLEQQEEISIDDIEFS